MALVTRSFSLKITPGGVPPTVHVSEYDVNRQFTVTLLDEDGQAFAIPSGTTAKIEGTLAGHGFSENAAADGSTVVFTLTENMTAYAGKAWVKIKLTKDNAPVSTCGFVLDVDRAGVEAGTVIGSSSFQEQINEAAAIAGAASAALAQAAAAQAAVYAAEAQAAALTLPAGGTAGQVIVSNGHGGASWATLEDGDGLANGDEVSY